MNDPVEKARRDKKCYDCGRCCQFGSGFLISEEKEKIAKFLNITIEELENKYLMKKNMFGTEAWKPKHPEPFGPCIFYDEEKHCTIHDVKPLLCKLGNCWDDDVVRKFYEKHFVNKDDRHSVDEWNLTQEIKNNEKR